MYFLLYQSKLIGFSELEGADPPMGCVSGILRIDSPIIEFTNFINSLGGNNEDGIVQISLNEEFCVMSSDNKAVGYMGGSILICPELNEIILELLGIGYPEYEKLFPHHVKNYQQQFSDT